MTGYTNADLARDVNNLLSRPLAKDYFSAMGFSHYTKRSPARISAAIAGSEESIPAFYSSHGGLAELNEPKFDRREIHVIELVLKHGYDGAVDFMVKERDRKLRNLHVRGRIYLGTGNVSQKNIVPRDLFKRRNG